MIKVGQGVVQCLYYMHYFPLIRAQLAIKLKTVMWHYEL